jgi:crotonobetainyl-CoA:carnitine CoA-transferase CaiB-like acyl-CoA transferase
VRLADRTLRTANAARMDQALDGALDGIAVVALATNIPGPLAAARLRSMGARVTKIEPARGDALDAACPQWYAEIVAGTKIMHVDLRADADLERLHVLLGVADVLITATRASALRRCGLDWSSVQDRHPRLCHVAIVGEAAPNDDRAGHDLTYQARAGLLSPPAMPRTVLADLAAAERAVTAALASLLKRERTGRGVRIEVAIVDAATSFAVPLRYGLTAPAGALGGALPTYALYPAADGWVALAALEEHFAARLKSVLGVERLDAPTLRSAMCARSVAQWERLAEEHDLPLAAFTAEEG